jgi:membrane-bound metal-dependent hydrolase YbcI (DUF457 family)
MCEGKTHAALAAIAYSAAAGEILLPSHLHIGLAEAGVSLVAGTYLAYGAGPANDIDQPGSAVSRSMGFLTRLFHDMIRPFVGGHRHGTHSILGCLVFAASVQAGVVLRGMPGPWAWAGRVWLGFLLSVIISSGLSMISVSWNDKITRRAFHYRDIVAMGLAALMLWTGWGIGLAAVSIGFGVFGHLAADSCTNTGCMLFWPFSRRLVHLDPEFLRFREDGAFENLILFPVAVGALTWIAFQHTGVTGPGFRYVFAFTALAAMGGAVWHGAERMKREAE